MQVETQTERQVDGGGKMTQAGRGETERGEKRGRKENRWKVQKLRRKGTV